MNNNSINKKSTNIYDIIKIIDDERNNRNNISWSKLSNTEKKFKLNSFIQYQKTLYNLTNNEIIKLKKILNSNKLNDSNITYSEDFSIKSIKNLDFDIKSRIYKYNNNKTIQTKHETKSKSNIERLCKKSIKNHYLN